MHQMKITLRIANQPAFAHGSVILKGQIERLARLSPANGGVLEFRSREPTPDRDKKPRKRATQRALGEAHGRFRAKYSQTDQTQIAGIASNSREHSAQWL